MRCMLTDLGVGRMIYLDMGLQTVQMRNKVSRCPCRNALYRASSVGRESRISHGRAHLGSW